LEIDKTDSHIPTATTTAGNIFFPKGQKPACPKNTRLQAHSSIGKDYPATAILTLCRRPAKAY
jgi:hypothetical protein